MCPCGTLTPARGANGSFTCLIHLLSTNYHVLPAGCLTMGPAAQLFPIALQDFRQWLMRGVDEQLRDALMAAELGEGEDALFNLFARFVLANFNDQIKLYR